MCKELTRTLVLLRHQPGPTLLQHGCSGLGGGPAGAGQPTDTQLQSRDQRGFLKVLGVSTEAALDAVVVDAAAHKINLDLEMAKK